MNEPVMTSRRFNVRFASDLAKRVFFLCLGAALLHSSVSAAAKIDDMRGTVEKRAPGALQWRIVSPGDLVEEGSFIRTSARSYADILTEQGHHLVIRSESTVQFKSLQSGDTNAFLEKGRVKSKVNKLKDLEKFSLQTPTAVCAVRGTEFDTMAGEGRTLVAVFHGVVGVATSAGGNEIRVPAGQMTSVANGQVELPRPIPQETQRKAAESPTANEARHEVGLDMDRNAVIAAAAMERRYADYTEGKSLIDVEGRRVRLDEYIVRTAANQFKFVVLNERDDRLDYFYYKGTFNQALPADLSVALKDLSGKLGSTAPDYFLTAYETGQSNTQDSILDTASGGHLIKIEMDGSGNYVLTDADDSGNTRTVQAAELTDAVNDLYKVYNPVSDTYVFNVAGESLADYKKIGVYLSDTDSYKNLSSGDVFWKTRFNSYSHAINGISKYSYVQSGANNILSLADDATETIAGGYFFTEVKRPDASRYDVTITRHYGDGTEESYRTVLIDDDGNIAPTSAFEGVTNGSDYKGELLKWNYEQQVTATEFEGRSIDLVVEPKIFIKSGLIQ